ncbi:sensor domain-containing diguanylate cyclase [Alteromonas sp. ASW11-19]|uniref:diguanylate cyclase n=1 Tax=Alteromonas salexigens TaxID=2982530 RepID=A0ABT2VMJ1_9ALTE|nr:sensor domain-containing diguanylate cyclase [Alteromonas salexigens]MCU7553451.1 sensor domain-containing diguanylate cyclase [Alteromonas salexigens]
MNAFRTLHRSILLLFAVVVIAIVTLVHFSISKIVAEQSRAQQQSLSPAISLIVEQLLKPLHISEALGKSRQLVSLLEAPTLNEDEVYETLARLEDEFGMTFFLASEDARMQYNSDGTSLALKEGEVSWYFKYKDVDAPAVADIGKWEDTHFYIDIKLFNDNGRFLGFFGIGKSLKSFISVFETYKQQYGYDFLFVDKAGDIMLSSDPDLVASYSEFTNLTELPWYASLPLDVQNLQALNNKLVSIDQEEYLIAEVKLNQFDWTVYLLSPLDERQAEISQAFIFSVVTLLIVVFSLFLLIYNLLYYFRQDMQPELIVRNANRLPDRNNLAPMYQDIITHHESVSVILVDIDNFGVINDTYGRNVGDEVLDKVATFLTSSTRENDIVGRWSSEEFIVFLPGTGPHEATEIAQNLRHGLATSPPLSSHPQLQITGSFGVSFTASKRPMNEVTAHAEDALYQARRDGCNLVRVQLID